MAINIFELYGPIRAGAPTVDYPVGFIKNESVPGANDGTPLDQQWANDYAGFDAALFDEVSLTPDGNPDTANASQRLDAIKKVSGRTSGLVFDSVADMIAGSSKITWSSNTIGTVCKTGSGEWVQSSFSSPMTISDFTKLSVLYVDDFITSSVSAGIQVAVDLAKQISIDNAGGSPQSERPAVCVRFSDGFKYTLDAKILIDEIRGIVFDCEGRALIDTTSLGDYGFEVTGIAFNHIWNGLAFQSSSLGCVKYDATNASGALVTFNDCRFMEHPDREAIGVDYTNQSSSLSFNRCFFHRVRTAAHLKNQDMVTWNECWFEPGVLSTYTSKDGYIRLDKGFGRVNNSVFSAGPSNGLGGATEVAYFNVGIEGAPAPAVDNGHLVISKTRIGFETGAGALVNWFVPPTSDTGSGFKTGVILTDCEVSPREDQETMIDGSMSTPLFRLFNMPNLIKIESTISTQDRQCVASAGSTTDLETLRGQAGDFTYYGPIDSFASSNSSRHYEVEGISCPKVYASATSDSTEYAKWLELFGKSEYWFDSDNTGSAVEVIIDTYFFPSSSTDNLETGLFEVVSGGRTSSVSSPSNIQVSPLKGYITTVYNSTTGLITAVFNDALNYGALTRTWDVDVVFYNTNTDTELASISLAQAPVSYIRLKVTNSDSTDIRLRGAYIKPWASTLTNSIFRNGITQK